MQQLNSTRFTRKPSRPTDVATQATLCDNPRGALLPFSVLILTYNEALNVRGCIDQLNACCPRNSALEIGVLDSHSTDNTAEVASSLQANVYSRSFDSFASQRNWGMSHIPWTNDWILHLDADERVTIELMQEVELATAATDMDAYEISSRLIFMNRWIKRSSRFPTYQFRLLNRHTASFVSRGHGQYLSPNCTKTARLKHPYDHYSFSKGLHHWLEKHNSYSTAEANDAVIAGSIYTTLQSLAAPRSSEDRQQALKSLSMRLPAKPILRFLYCYILRGGFLDGKAGLHYALLMLTYEYMITIKRIEIQTRASTNGKATLPSTFPAAPPNLAAQDSPRVSTPWPPQRK